MSLWKTVGQVRAAWRFTITLIRSTPDWRRKSMYAAVAAAQQRGKHW